MAIFFERMFLFRIDGRQLMTLIFMKNDTKPLSSWHQKSLPLARLVRLSNEFPNRIEMIEDPDGTDRTGKKLQPSFDSMRYRKSSRKKLPRFAFAEEDLDLQLLKLQKSMKEKYWAEKTLKQFFESLNYNPKKVSSPDIPDIGLFLSSGMTLLLDHLPLQTQLEFSIS